MVDQQSTAATSQDAAIETFLGGIPSQVFTIEGQIVPQNESAHSAGVSTSGETHIEGQLTGLENIVGNLVHRISQIEIGQGQQQ